MRERERERERERVSERERELQLQAVGEWNIFVREQQLVVIDQVKLLLQIIVEVLILKFFLEVTLSHIAFGCGVFIHIVNIGRIELN